jgi:hypothetical protein
MPHWLIHGAAIAGRVFAGVVGCVCFYMAFFMYEDEEGAWQNRIEDFWSSIYDRAKVTDSTSTALFNKIGQTLRFHFDKLFGEKLWSMRSAATSVNLSYCGVLIVLITDGLTTSKNLIGLMYNLGQLWWVLTLLGVLLLLTFLPTLTPRRSAIVLSAIPAGLIILIGIVVITGDRDRDWLSPPIELSLSILSDYLAIVVLRKIFITLSTTVSIRRLTLAFLSIFCCFFLISVGPFLASRFLFERLYRTSEGENILGSLNSLSMQNIPTGLLLLIPAATLVVVLLHKVIWPILSRLLYPIASRRVIANHALLISTGAAALAIAANVQRFGVAFIIDHLK